MVIPIMIEIQMYQNQCNNSQNQQNLPINKKQSSNWKQSSMYLFLNILRQLSKLKIKIQNNTQLIALKDQMIQQLRDQLRKGSPIKQNQQIKVQQLPNFVIQKINDIEIKYSCIIENQSKLAQKITDLNNKIQQIQKGMLSVLACKIANIQAKNNQFIKAGSQKLVVLQQNLQNINQNKKQLASNSSYNKGPASIFQLSTNMQSISQRLQNIRQQLLTFKTKQFRYENSNIMTLRNDMSILQNILLDLQKKFKLRNSKLKNSNSSSRKNYDQRRMNSGPNSCYFQDYEQVYEDVDSLGEDQFFHPLDQSTRRFQKQSVNVTGFYSNSNSKPTTSPHHNDSFQNFTDGDQDQQVPPNQNRILQPHHLGGPQHYKVDFNGNTRKKTDHRNIFSNQKKAYILNAAQLNQCKEKPGLIFKDQGQWIGSKF